MKKINFLVAFLVVSFSSFAQPDPKATEVWSPVPLVVTPGNGNSAPSDAIILFNGKNLDQWTDIDGKESKWIVKDGTFTVANNGGDYTKWKNLITKKSFGDIQLHIEFKEPENPTGTDQNRGNSGVFLQGLYEVQILDCYNNKTYVNGQTGAIYKQHAPLVNACKKPGEWQTYDIIFIAPKFKADNTLDEPARVTVMQNGILIQNAVEIKGAVTHVGQPSYTAHGKAPFHLQDHGHPVSFRNVWVREL